MSNSVYGIVTDRIIKQLEAGTIPWRRPWAGNGNEPRSAATRKPYRGCNVFILSAASYDSPLWITYRQAGMFGGNVKRGERGWPVVFWQIGEAIDQETGEKRKTFLLRYYTVFNVAQCEGLPEKVTQLDTAPDREFSPVEACERLIAELPASSAAVKHIGNQACYVPSLDEVRMPRPERFDSAEDYYAVLFHELTHSTGHGSRLNRDGIAQISGFGSASYSREELIAEMGSAFLCGHAGIDVPALQDNSAAYLAGWIKALRGDSKLIVQAAASAQKAADWLLGHSAAEQASEAEPEAVACG